MAEQRPPLHKSATVNFFDTLATPKQMAWVRDKAKELGQEPDEFSRASFGCSVDQLTKAQAYELIRDEKMGQGYV